MFNQEPINYHCPFCRIQKAGLHNDSDFVYESQNVFVVMALHQHEGSGPTVLVIPKAHIENLYGISDELLCEISKVSKLVAIKMRELWPIQGITVWQHNESAGFQDVWHFHTHIKGRFENDNLYSAKNIAVSVENRALLAAELRDFINT